MRNLSLRLKELYHFGISIEFGVGKESHNETPLVQIWSTVKISRVMYPNEACTILGLCMYLFETYFGYHSVYKLLRACQFETFLIYSGNITESVCSRPGITARSAYSSIGTC